MSMKWGNDPDAPTKPPPEDPKREGSTLFFAALFVSIVYALVLGAGAWLKTLVKVKHPIQANPAPISAPPTR